jgi:plastocyanin
VKIGGVGRRVRLLGLVAVALGVVAVAGQPLASGAATTVQVAASGSGTEPKVFTQATVTIQVGDTVQWTNASGFHNVHFDDGAFTQPATPQLPANWPATVQRTFDAPGTYTYVCDAHKNVGMTGTVIVQAAPSSPTPTPPPTATATPPPTGGSPVAPPQLRSVKVTRTHFCTKRSRTCKKPGVVLAIDLSGPAAVTGTLTRAPLRGAARYKRFGTVDFGQIAAGKRELRFSRTKSGRRLTPARYKLVLQAAGATRTLRFRVR